MDETLCSAPNPEHPEVLCDKPLPCHYMHESRAEEMAWPGKPPSPVPPASSRRARMKEIADSIPPSKKTGPPDLREHQHQVRDPAWVEYASEVLHTYCREHQQPFTTPEHLWPLLDAPEEKRQMHQPVRRALGQRWMSEVGSRRLRDIYRTRDGVEFQLNKLVPVYQSRIYQGRTDENISALITKEP
jgi:hypothetical protein